MESVACVMPIHRILWTTTVAATQSISVIEEAINWLTPDDITVKREKIKSWHGSKIHSLTADITKKKGCITCLAKLGEEVLQQIMLELEERLDDQKQLHIRLCQNKLVTGNIELVDDLHKKQVVKGRIKFVVYPNEHLQDIVESEIIRALDIAKNEN